FLSGPFVRGNPKWRSGYGTVPFTGVLGALSRPLELRPDTVTIIWVAAGMSVMVASLSVTMTFFNSGLPFRPFFIRIFLSSPLPRPTPKFEAGHWVMGFGLAAG